MNRYLIITVDTEGDNLWNCSQNNIISTENAVYIQPFQSLCEQYGLKPVYLTDYEMAKDNTFVNNAKSWLLDNNCEIGIHVHAWNNPPFFDLIDKFHGNPYLIEYPLDVMEAKFKTTYDLIYDNFGIRPRSHRAGRWAMDQRYFEILKKYGIITDCSCTPGISWKRNSGMTISGGSDYRYSNHYPHMICDILEVPVTIRHFSHYFSLRNVKHCIKTVFLGETIWLRPSFFSLKEMMDLVRNVSKEDDNDYLEFMIHSSELMPNGSPYFKNSFDVERLYSTMDSLFSFCMSLGYSGITLSDFYQDFINEKDILSYR